jgi:hypothetical protein
MNCNSVHALFVYYTVFCSVVSNSELLETFGGRLYTGNLGLYTYVKSFKKCLCLLYSCLICIPKTGKYIGKSVCMAVKHGLSFWGNTRDEKCEVKDATVL